MIIVLYLSKPIISVSAYKVWVLWNADVYQQVLNLIINKFREETQLPNTQVLR